MHGPKSVLCTQVSPLECVRCSPQSPPARHDNLSSETLATRQHESESKDVNGAHPSTSIPADLSRATTSVESLPSSPIIEKHPLYSPGHKKQSPEPRFSHGRTQGDTCASCSFSVPQDVAAHLPEGARGSPRPDGKGTNGSPVLRSREKVCLGGGSHENGEDQVPNGAAGNALLSGSFRSVGSVDSQCHDHLLTYLTVQSPDDPKDFSTLRASVIRTLSCELLPRGMSDGPFCFGDSTTGYTIAYVFRLTDPKARGRRRAYAFVALAGRDTRRAFRACPMVWEAFATMAKAIEEAAHRSQEEQKDKEEKERDNKKGSDYTPISSFLTQRAVDPDGFPRRAGQTSPRSLADIIGDEKIFAILHQFFVALLRCLGERFGGMPLASQNAVYHTSVDETAPADVNTQPANEQKSQQEHAAPTANNVRSDMDAALANLKISSPSLTPAGCGPIPADKSSGHQVAV